VLCGTHRCDVSDDDSYLGIDAVDPLAVAAYIGDLHSLGYLSRGLFTTCVAYMVNNFTRSFHLHCIEVVLERASSSPVPRLEPRYVLECIATIRRRASVVWKRDLCREFEIWFSQMSFDIFLRGQEEDSLIHLLYSLLFKTHTTKLHYEREDSRLSPPPVEVTESCPMTPVTNHNNSDKTNDHRLSAQSPALNSASSPVRFCYQPRTFEELDLIWEYCDAVYASPDPEDIPPIDF
jgi:hypothetical protein